MRTAIKKTAITLLALLSSGCYIIPERLLSQRPNEVFLSSRYNINSEAAPAENPEPNEVVLIQPLQSEHPPRTQPQKPTQPAHPQQPTQTPEKKPDYATKEEIQGIERNLNRRYIELERTLRDYNQNLKSALTEFNNKYNQLENSLVGKYNELERSLKALQKTPPKQETKKPTYTPSTVEENEVIIK